MIRFTRKRALVCGAAAFIATVATFITVSLVNNFNASAATGTTNLWIGGKVGNTTYFKMTVDGQNEVAYCGDRYDNTPYGVNSGWHNGIGMTIVPVSANSSMTDKRIFGIMYIGQKYQYGVTTIHNALHDAVRGYSESSYNQHTKNLFKLVNNAINDGSLFEGIKDAKYYYTNTKAINSSWQRIYTISYADQVEEKFNLSVSKTWNDTDETSEIHDVFYNNSHPELVAKSADISIKYNINVSYNGSTKPLREWTRGSDTNWSASESDISCHAVKNDLFGVSNDYSCAGLTLTATETPSLAVYQSPTLFTSTLNPSSVTVTNGGNANFVFNNEFKTTFVNVAKTWEDNNTLSNDERPHYIDFEIKYRLANSTIDTWDTFKVYNKVETNCSKIRNADVDLNQKEIICRTATEKFTFNNLPAFLKINGQYRLVEYKAFETKLYDAEKNDITSKYTSIETATTIADSGDTRSTSQSITNSDLTTLPVKKEWIGDEDYPEDRPQSITVALMCGDNAVVDDQNQARTLTLNADNNWEGEFTGLSSGECASYSVEETTELSEYTSVMSVKDGVYVFRNYHDIDIRVKKQWTGDQPDVDNLTVTLTCFGNNTALDTAVLNAANNWTYDWTGRDYNECGGADNYFASEVGYNGEFKLSGTIVSKDTDGTWLITLDNFKKIDIPVTKAWKGRSEDMRLTEVTAVLLCEDSNGDTAPYLDSINGENKEVVLNAGNNWTGTFTDILASDCDGLGIAEKSIDGTSLYEDGDIVSATTATADDFKFKVTYTGNAAKGFTITNEQLIDIPVEKVWDEDNADDRPAGITALLMCENTGEKSSIAGSHVLSAENYWKYTWTDLSTSRCERYSIDEVPYSSHGYDSSYSYEVTTGGDESTKLILTNTKYVNVPVIKVWNYRNPENIPSSVKIALTCNSSDVGEPVTLTEANMLPSGEWLYDGFKHLKASDCPTGYNVREIIPENANYNVTISTFNDHNKTRVIANTEEYYIPVEKRWDSGRSDNDLPETVDVALFCGENDTAVQTVTLRKSENWKGSFGPFNNGDCEEDYSIEEVTEVEGFESTISGNADDGFVVTNTEYTHLEVNKTWEKRDTTQIPAWIRVYLVCNDDPGNSTYMRSVVISPDSNTGAWSYDFTRLKTSACSNYGVEEYLPGDYSFELTENSKTGNTVNLTNTEQIYVPVRKDWNSSEDTDLPEIVTVKLYCGNTYVDSAELEAPFYYYEFGPYGINDCASSYRVEEDPEIEGFEISYATDEDGTLLITNTEKQDITVTKNWEVADGKEVDLPESITVALWCETTDSEIADNRKTLTKEQGYAGGWSGITRDICAELGVREIAADGTTILSTIGERYNEYFFYGGVSGSAAEGFTLTNIYDGIDISGTKTWVFTDDHGNTQSVSKRPVSINVSLKQDDEIVDTVVVRADASGAWNYNFDNWPKYDENGDEYIYTIDEAPIAYYVKTINGYNITNKYQPEYTTVTASKDWATLAGTTLPEQVEVKLFCGDADLQKSKYITKASNWAAVSWENLDVQECEAGYRAEEVLPEGFAKSVTVGSNNNYTFTNAETVDIPVTKTWVKRNSTTLPESVTVALYCKKNGQSTKLDEQILNAASNWAYTWETRNVKNDNCEGGAYTVDEVSTTPNFKKTKVDYTTAEGYVIENTETTSQKVIKVWEGDTKQDRPGSIVAELMCGDTVKKTYELSEANNEDGDNTWEYTWTDLLISDCEQGYTVRESFNIPNYKTSYETRADGTVVITNKRTTQQKVIKVWKNDDETKRPGYIEASLMCGDKTIETVKLSEENNLDGDDIWEYTWTDLLVSDCEQGYTVDESINIPNYHKTVTVLEDGTVVITNEFDNPDTADKTAFGFGRIAGISAFVLIAGFFTTRRIFGRR